MKTKVFLLTGCLAFLFISANAQPSLANIRIDFLTIFSLEKSTFVIEKSKDLTGISYMDLSVYKLNQPLNKKALSNPQMLSELITEFKGNNSKIGFGSFEDLGKMSNYHIYFQAENNIIIATDSNNPEIILQGKLKNN